MLIENGIMPTKLRDVILSKRCHAFVGSGLSSGLYHSWFGLVNAICERCGIARRITKDSTVDELLDAAQDAKAGNKRQYFGFLGEHFGRSLDQTPLIYDLLLSLPFECYLTVNLDPLLARKARLARTPCVLPVRAYPSLDRRQMFSRSLHYLHGFIEAGKTPVEGTIVLARDEFLEAYRDNSNLMNFLVPTLENDPVLFVGCGLREPSMPQVFKICKEHQTKRQKIMVASGSLPSSPPQRYILLPKPSVTNEAGDLVEDQSREEMERQQTYYTSLDIEPVWFENSGDDFSALRVAVEDLANLPDIRPNYGW